MVKVGDSRAKVWGKNFFIDPTVSGECWGSSRMDIYAQVEFIVISSRAITISVFPQQGWQSIDYPGKPGSGQYSLKWEYWAILRSKISSFLKTVHINMDSL